MKFELTLEEIARVDAWYEGLKPRITKQQSQLFGGIHDKLTDNGKSPYYGAIGGGLSYTFTPTGMGVVTVVKEAITGETLDLTEYDLW